MALAQLGLVRPVLARPLLSIIRASVAGHPAYSCTQCYGQRNLLTPTNVRFYAAKKSKAKGKGQPVARVEIKPSLVEDIISLQGVKDNMTAVLTTLKDDFSRSLNIRTTPGALDHITVNTKNGKFPLNQLGQISMKSPQMILVNMTGFPEATAAAVRALRESSMRLNPEVDGALIRVPIPVVTREHRENLAKLAKEFSNKAKDSLRKVRSAAFSTIKKSEDGVSEDTIHLLQQQVHQMTESFSADIDRQLAAKTKELLG